MALLIDKEDFVGEYQFQFQHDEQYWDKIIDDTEKQALIGLFGKSIYQRFVNNTASHRFFPIVNPFFLYGRHCRGLKYFVLTYVYSRLITHDGVVANHSVQKIKGGTTKDINVQANYTRAWNEAASTGELIRWRLLSGVRHLHDYEFLENYEYSVRIW